MTQDVGAVNLCVQMTLFSTPATKNELIKVIVPFNEVAFYPSETILFGRLPVGYTLESFTSLSNSSYRLSLAIDRASRLYGGSIKCGEYMGEKVAAVCPVAECKTIEESMTLYCVSHTSVVPGSPLNLHQISSASSVVVQWESPLETGASGVYISEYRKLY